MSALQPDSPAGASAEETGGGPRERKRLKRPSILSELQGRDWLTRLKKDAKSGTGGLFVSGALHAVLLIIAAVYVFTRDETQFIAPLDLGWLTESARAAIVKPEAEFAPIELPNTPATAPPEMTEEPMPEEVPAAVSRPSVSPVDVTGALSGRRPDAQAAAAGDSGVNDEARRAIDKALGWLARHQQANGRWRLDEGYADAGRIRTDTGATALALLAFLGAGHTHQEGSHQAVVQKGLDWLRSTQRANGDLFDIAEEGKDAHFYAHAQGTIVLCEALALTGDPALVEPATRAVEFLAAAQNPVRGGWKYRPLDATGIGDLSVTGWALMALHSARMAGIDVPPEAYLLASAFLDSVQESPREDAFYKYRPDWAAAPEQRWSMTAEGLLCRQWLGWPKEDPALIEGVQFLLSEQNAPTWDSGRRNLYAWYYTGQTLHNIGGDEWIEWFHRVQHEITSHQSRDGSWHPTNPRGAPLEYADLAGRLYLTVLAVLVLETPYRHAPIYRETE